MSEKKRTPKKSISGWVITRKITQGAALVIFTVTLILSKHSILPTGLTSGLVRLSPLAVLASLLSSKVFLAGSALGMLVLLSSFFVGRAWCGWLCPLGTLLDICRFPKRKNKLPLPEALRKIKYGLLGVILISAALGNLTFIFFDPVTIFVRSLTLVVLPLLDKGIYALEVQLSGIPLLANGVYAFDTWLRPGVFPSDSALYQHTLVFGLFLIVILLLNYFADRFWCRYLCPLGALLGIGSRFSLIQRRVEDTCVSCAACAKVCPTGTIDNRNGFASDPAECTMCMECKPVCAPQAIRFTGKWQKAASQAYDPGRRMFIGSVALSAVSVALFGIKRWIRPNPQYLLRPPGVEDNDRFLATCVRCGLCEQGCPTQALQSDAGSLDVEGFGAPLLVPRIGYCAFSCNLCGQLCPVGAIPKLALAEKRKVKIGHAVIDHERCLAWGKHENCIVCEEMCPLPQKAITLETSSSARTDGTTGELLLPVVDMDKCIGCGICENKCPVEGEAAIRVNGNELAA